MLSSLLFPFRFVYATQILEVGARARLIDQWQKISDTRVSWRNGCIQITPASRLAGLRCRFFATLVGEWAYVCTTQDRYFEPKVSPAQLYPALGAFISSTADYKVPLGACFQRDRDTAYGRPGFAIGWLGDSGLEPPLVRRFLGLPASARVHYWVNPHLESRALKLAA